MGEINVNLSVSNLPQVDRYHNESHRAPIVHQDQNIHEVNRELNRRVNMPVEADTIEKKGIDPDDRRSNHDNKKKRRRRTDDKRQEPPDMTSDGRSLIDVRV